MSAPTPGSPRAAFAAAAEEMRGEFERQRRKLTELQERMRSVSATAESPLGLVTATVGAQGELTTVTVHPRKFKRATPEQLGTEIVAAVAAARAEAGKQVAAAMPPSPFSGVSFTDIASGELDLADLMPDPSALFGGATRKAGDATAAARRTAEDDGWAEVGA